MLNTSETQELHELIGVALAALALDQDNGSSHLAQDARECLTRARELAAVLVSDSEREAWTLTYATADDTATLHPLLNALTTLARAEGACITLTDQSGIVLLDVAPDDDTREA